MDKRHYCLLSCILLFITGCNTPQQRAHNTPKPIPSPQQQSQSANSSNTQASGSRPNAAEQSTQNGSDEQNQTNATASQQNAQAATDVANQTGCEPQPKQANPDVEIIDVPLDENGNPIEPIAATDRQVGLQNDECQTAQPSSSAQQDNQASNRNQQRQGGATAGSISKAQTGEEKAAAANTQLDERLAAFDAMMRRARDEAARERQAGSGNPSGAMGGLGANQNTPDARRGAGGQADSSSGAGHTPDRSGVSRPADYQHAATGPIPADLPDAKDDDIVARQLREAATKESDPVLREKLWDEYRRYKNGLVGK